MCQQKNNIKSHMASKKLIFCALGRLLYSSFKGSASAVLYIIIIAARCVDPLVLMNGIYFWNRAVSDMIEKLLNSSRYNSRTRPASERGEQNYISMLVLIIK